jgi:DNA-binding SARP family transcriptional activator
VELRLLGPLEVHDNGRIVPIGGGRRRSLLALLALHPNEIVSTDRLIDELWGDRPPATASKGLQVQVSQLRKDLAYNGNGEALQTRSNGYVLRISPDRVDIRRFERALEEGERALSAGEPERAAERLSRALAMWRGPPLADFTYEPFAQREIARLEELRLVAVEQRIEAELALGHHGRVVAELEGLVAEQPLRERLRWLLMLALYRCGRRAEALEVYREGRRAMVDELGLEPGPALRELQAEILADRPELAPPTVTPPQEQATAPRKPPARTVALLIGAAVLLGLAVVAAALREDGRRASPPAPVVLDLAPNAIAAIDPAKGLAEDAFPLPGYPTGVASAGDAVLVVTVDSSALTVLDAASRAIVRTVPLRLTPGAVAVDDEGAWVADARRGTLVRFKVGYEKPVERLTWPRRGDGPTEVALGAGAVWVTDGSRTLTRVDSRSHEVSGIPAGRPLDGVTFGAGAVWAFSSKTATVLRVDAGSDTVTPIPIVTRPGSAAAAPRAIAATSDAVWVLNANTATVTKIDAEQGGVIATIRIGIDRAPSGFAAWGETVWVSNADGTLSRIGSGGGEPASLWVGESLGHVIAGAGRVWVTTRALDQTIPGGAA